MAIALGPQDAYDFHLWCLKAGKLSKGWRGLLLTDADANHLNFQADLSLLGRKVKLSGTVVLSPERFIEFRVGSFSPRWLRSEPAIIRWAFQPMFGGTLVTHTWHFGLETRWRRTFEWALASNLKLYFRDMPKFEGANLRDWQARRGAVLDTKNKTVGARDAGVDGALPIAARP